MLVLVFHLSLYLINLTILIKYCPLVFLLMPLFCLSRISQTLQGIAESQLGTPVLYELIEVRGQERDVRLNRVVVRNGFSLDCLCFRM